MTLDFLLYTLEKSSGMKVKASGVDAVSPSNEKQLIKEAYATTLDLSRLVQFERF